jgi:hypothetical protein
MASAPKMPLPVHEVENVLAFRTKPGAETVKGGESRELGIVDTSRFDKIRLVADERVGSTCNVVIRMTIQERERTDHISGPHSSYPTFAAYPRL